MNQSERVFVVGHRNPDTDSICSAIAYAALCRRQGRENVFPARAGGSIDRLNSSSKRCVATLRNC